VLGVETSTLDDSGEVVARHDMRDVTVDAAREVAAAHLTGPILQVPPMVSALHVRGRRLHELAREGIEVEREPRPVVVHRFDIDSTEDPMVLRIAVECSSGTYVRSLAADLGRLLGGGAHVRRLRRTAVGSFDEQDARALDQAELLPPAEALRDYEQVIVDDDTVKLISHGRALPPFSGDGPWAVLGPDGDLIAVYEAAEGQAQPAVVLSAS
jgi:tRNA pseudouridine55 synthase